jgi:hypothetical protein
MTLVFRRNIFLWSGLLAALPLAASAATVSVNGLPDVPGVSYEKLSSAVNYVQLTPPEYPDYHVITITTDQLPGADGEVRITQPMLIEGDGNGNGVPCDILVDTEAIGLKSYTSVGQPNKGYLELECSGTVTIRNLKIHPNSDGPGPAAEDLQVRDGVCGILTYRPAGTTAEAIANYIFENVWASGSDASNSYVPLDTADDLYGMPGVKRWAFDPGEGTNSTTQSVIQIENVPVQGAMNVTLSNCHAGLSKMNAMNIMSRYCPDAIVRGGVYGHSNRDGIYVVGRWVTLTGSPTNRLRVVRVPYQGAKNSHGIHINITDGLFRRVEYVDVATITTGNNIKFAAPIDANKTIEFVENCRFMGHLDAGSNASAFAQGRVISTIRKSTFVGDAAPGAAANAYRPFETNANIGGTVTTANMNFFDCIFTSDYNVAESTAGTLAIPNTDGLGGPRTINNSALPTDAYPGESLADPPITGVNSDVILVVNSVSESPRYVATLANYDWSEAAVSIDGSNPNAGNPTVYLPGNQFYKAKASDGTDLTGGAGGIVPAANVLEWSLY